MVPSWPLIPARKMRVYGCPPPGLLSAVMDQERRVTAKAFHDSPGVEDWRVLYWGAYALYPTSSFAQAASFVSAIAEAAASVGHAPDVDVRPEGVTVRTFSRLDGTLSAMDAQLAARISVKARELGLTADPAGLQMVGIAVAQDEGVDTRPFWAAAFGYE